VKTRCRAVNRGPGRKSFEILGTREIATAYSFRPLLALSRHDGLRRTRPLSGAKRTFLVAPHISAYGFISSLKIWKKIPSLCASGQWAVSYCYQ
jgi:hypothetical protein